MHLPKFGGVDVVEVIGEYLSSLIEQSPLKDVLAGWMGWLAGAQPAVDIVVPDPARLQHAAAAQLNAQPKTNLAQREAKDPAAIEALQKEPDSLASAVDLANVTGHLEGQSGPCRACIDIEQRPEPVRPGFKIP